MTKERYFYTDPLAAAWMAKHFAMKLAGSNGSRIEFYSEDAAQVLEFCEYASIDGINGYYPAQRAYVHPDSLHLLMPQLGDKSSDGLIWNGAKWQCQWALMEADQSHTAYRNDIVFHWPEKEET